MIRPETKTAALAAVFVCGLLLFQEGIGWAKGTAGMRLLVREEYNDNIFLTPHSERSDFITTVEPGISAELATRHVDLFLDYGLRFRFFHEFTDESETRLKDVQRALARAEILPERNFTITVLDEYSRVNIDPRRQIAEEDAIVNTTNRNRLLVNPRYRFRPGTTFSATLGYQYEDFYYDAPEGDDTTSHRFTLDLARQLSPRLEAFLGAGYQTSQADITRDFRRRDAYAGLLWKPTPALTLEGRGGIARIDFRGDPPPGITGKDEHSSANWEVNGSWGVGRFTPRVGYTENFTSSVNLGLVETKRATAALGYGGRWDAEAALYREEVTYLEVDREDRATGGTLNIGLPLGRFLHLGLRGDYARLKFLPEDEKGDRYGAGAEISYKRKLLNLALGGSYRDRKSNIPNNEYRSRIVYAQAGFRF